ncbi:uncharacterized protein BO97DRAFT_424264 [Aspergillus homomorphus CBS 101889]|uniref:Uncharacterized protein n=1 Tax=Aspergillus homomorphus (strain CBS 101889) TaxID=1450537 RepID=A0A395HXW8_ASPHC|nr:hypothetical protein BO97DRAFT_424264 [Aspergillus homomorphus CBS 101889]RAL12630.1 hypothetical protein BO97DRAFT_424264 [Aspergillus homomorphus CBS 101889]
MPVLIKDRHSQIVAELQAVESAPGTLKAQEAYLSDRCHALAETRRGLEQIRQITQVERERHEQYRDSTVRRLLYRATGKRENFEAKADREMHEFYRARAEENRLNAQRQMLEAQISDAVRGQKALQVACTKRRLLHAELEALYCGIFDGPTEELPEEDEQEEATRAARTAYGQRKERWSNLCQATQCLVRAQTTVKEAVLDLYESLQHYERDMWGFGASIATDWEQQNRLARAQQKVGQTQMLVTQARRLDRDVQPLPAMQIVQRDMISGLIFGTFLFNVSFLDMLQQLLQNVQRAEQALAVQLRRAKSRKAEMQSQVADAQRTFEIAQQDLRRIREWLFTKAADPPSPYSEPSSLEVESFQFA